MSNEKIKLKQLTDILELDIDIEDFMIELLKECIDRKKIKITVGVHPIIDDKPAIESDARILDLSSIEMYGGGPELEFKLNNNENVVIALTYESEQ